MRYFKFALFICAIYLCGAFVSGGFNPEHWDSFWKLVLVIIAVTGGLIYVRNVP